MKKTLLFCALLFGYYFTQAQWSTVAPNTNFTYTGKVGIGTTNYAGKLTVRSDNYYTPYGGGISVQSGSNDNVMYLNCLNGMGTIATSTSIPSSLSFYSSGGSATLLSNGNFGIGTPTPAAKFHLVGGYGRIENPTESSIQYKATTPGQFWDVGTNNYGYYVYEVNSQTFDFVINKNGNVGIGVINADAKLAVNGTIHTKEVKVDLNGWPVPDYVFETSYKLPSLTEVQNYIQQNKHLPEVPSAKEMEANGMNLKEMNLLLLKKVEELTLYMIEQNKYSHIQSEQLANQEQKILALEKMITDLNKK